MSGGRKPTAGQTDFESMSHAQLIAMLKSADKSAAADIAAKLASAADTIHKIGEDLKAHVSVVNWKGQGADAFREWGTNTANATIALGDYSETSGTWMGRAADAIAEAHASMPSIVETQTAQAALDKAADSVKGGKDNANIDMQMQHANMRLSSTHQEAARQMSKLAQAYVHSGTQINQLKPPTFAPPADAFGEEWRQPEETRFIPPPTRASVSGSSSGGGVSHVSGDSSTSTVSHATAFTPTHHVTTGVDNTVTHVASHTTPPPAVTHTEIDAVAPPAAPSAPPLSHQPPLTQPDGPKAPPLGYVPPALGGAPGGVGSGIKGGPGGLSTRPPGFPGGRLPGVSTPGGLNSGGRSTIPRDEGITGGKAVQSNTGRPPARIPRGTVVGAEEGGTTGRPMTGRGMSGMHAPGGGAGGAGRNGLVGGRRLASEPGGVVGRQPQSERVSSRPFTQGGSGLNRAGATGAEETAGRQPGQAGRPGMPHGSTAGRRRRDEQGGDRPDYLTEEEETWQQGNRRIVPPVID